MKEESAPQEIVLDILSEKVCGLTAEEILAGVIERNLDISADELDSLLRVMESSYLIRSKKGMTSKWYITMRGFLSIEKCSGAGWP
ncbi:MAG: hypothetical protein HXS47_11530 [Theionarchaea archaeon]|nr:hypothetical protein [Theionarchaea archaeon]